MADHRYDAEVIAQYADKLYLEARWIMVTTGIKYGIVSLMGSAALGLVLFRTLPPYVIGQNDSAPIILFGIVALALIGTGLGVHEGEKKAFSLKLEAQQALCQRQIEMNTRGQEN